jgi:hypothetical protein
LNVRVQGLNDGRVVHALQIEGEGIEDKTPGVPPDESAQRKVDLKSGPYDLYRPGGNHKGRGMDGAVTVREG